jgi:hypothetical protein
MGTDPGPSLDPNHCLTVGFSNNKIFFPTFKKETRILERSLQKMRELAGFGKRLNS